MTARTGIRSLLSFACLGVLGCDHARDQAEPNASLGTCVPADAPPPDDVVFEIGCNIAGAATDETYWTLHDDDEAPIIRGTVNSGQLMLVTAVRTNAFPSSCSRVAVTAELTLDDGTPLGKLSHKKRPMLDAGGGIRYLLNVFLVVPEDRPTFGLPNSWEGRRATLRVAMFVDDGAGGSVLRQESVVPVTLHEKAL